MKSNQNILKVFAIILLLTFSQKLGAGLYLHNWFHFKNTHQAAHSSASNVASYSCNCVDDFSMPFADPVCDIEAVTSLPEQCIVSIFIQPVPIRPGVFNSLRGPPMFLS
jgi:hypothetical protein